MSSDKTASLMSLMDIIVSYHQHETEGRSRLGGVVAMLFKQVYSFFAFFQLKLIFLRLWIN